MSGLKLASIYGFPPSRLGYCGLGTKKNLKVINDFLHGDNSLSSDVREILCTFEAAYSYYQLIAKANKMSDPFDRKVVEAYWLGNKFLENVKLNDIKKMIRSDFVRPNLLTKKQAEEKIKRLKEGVLPNHLFHVLFIGSITSRIKLVGKLIDVCRIGWGKVKKIKDKKIIVSYQPLAINGKYKFGKNENKTLVWDRDILSKLKVSDFVTFHWGRACQVLSKEQLKNINKYSLHNIVILN